MEGFEVGQRIVDPADKARGTIKYLGAVEGTKGSWIGVEWDNPERGKHDGSHNGKRYFETSTPTSGSFVRDSKISKGVSLEYAVEDRYGSSHEADPNEIERLRRDINAPFLQLVGFEKVNQTQSDFAKLKTISVRNMAISHSGNQLDSFMTSVQVLDIAESLFNSWNQVASLCGQLKKLKNLNISDNKLTLPMQQDDDDGRGNMKEAFQNVNTLFMGKMGYDWNACHEVLQYFSNLQALNLYGNVLNSIANPPPGPNGLLTSLTELNLSGNPLGPKWDNVMKFAKLPKLQTLAVNDCQLEEIVFNKENPGFEQLRVLQISFNKLKDWQSIYCIDYLPNLQEIKCRDNPIVDSESSQTSRQLVIAAAANLKVVNGTEVEKAERFGAEWDFIKKYGLEYLEATKDAIKLEEFHKKYPRYKTLVSKFGAPEESELRVKDTSLKANLLKVNIVCPDDDSVKPLSKSLPPAMVVSKLRGLLGRLIKPAKGKELTLSYSSNKKPDFKVPFDNDMRDLFFYNVESGDTIFVQWDD